MFSPPLKRPESYPESKENVHSALTEEYQQEMMAIVLPTGSIKCDNRVTSHGHLFDLCLFSGDSPAARPHARRIREDQATSRPARAYTHRTRHLQRDVERALLLQVLARAPETIAHAQQARIAGTGRERRYHRHWRRLGL